MLWVRLVSSVTNGEKVKKKKTNFACRVVDGSFPVWLGNVQLPLIRWGRGIGRNFHFWLISTSRVLQYSWVMALSWFLLGWIRVDFVVFTILPDIDWNKTAHRTEFLISVCPAGAVHRGRKLLLLGAGGPYDDPGRWPFRLPVVNLWAQKSSKRICGLKCDLIVYLL